ncbi:MAG: hypothetical protein AAF664_13630, partial [Planctomycetota bacterium]
MRSSDSVSKQEHRKKSQKVQDKPKAGSRTLRRGFAFMGATCAVATIGYHLAGWSWVDSIYM